LLYEEVRAPLSAENAFEHAIAANPDSDSLHNNLGYSLLLQKRSDEAETEFRKALQLNPASVTARNNLATVLARRGNLEEALEQFQKASDAAAAHNNLAVVLMEMEQYEQSRQQLVEALAIRQNFAPALANFKLVQERIREQAEVRKFGRVPLSAIRVPSALVALGQTTVAVEDSAKVAKDLEENK
jgi:Flp pilus assembly protein TadD